MATRQLTIRIEEDDLETLATAAHKARLSVNQVASALLRRALAEGWEVKPGQPIAVDRGGNTNG